MINKIPTNVPEEKKIIDVKDYLPKRNPESDLWNKVNELSQKEDGKVEAVNIIFEQQYKLPEDNIELIKKLASKEQPKIVRLQIAKNLEKYDHIPFGMYGDLFEILSNDPEPDVKKPLKNTLLYSLAESTMTRLKQLQPRSLTTSLGILSQKQDTFRQMLEPLSKIQTSEMSKQISQIQKTLGTLNLDKIKIPKVSFTADDFLLKELSQSTNKGFSADVILTKAAENNPKILEIVKTEKEIEIADKTLNDVSDQIDVLQKTSARDFKDIGDKQDEHHTEQMAEHQKTRDEILIENGKLQEKVDTLQEKIKNSWKEPKNWSIGFLISVIAGLAIWAIQSFS